MMFFIGILIPWNDPRLLAADAPRAARSPLTIALDDAGLTSAAHLINALIVISVISAGNSSLYVASRTILFMARTNKAPKWLSKVDSRGVPWPALLFSNLAACMAFLAVGSGAGVLFSALVTLSGVCTFMTWGTIELLHIRFRNAMRAQGQSVDLLPFKALWYPYGAYAALAANVVLIFFQGYTSFTPKFVVRDFVVAYILLPAEVALFLGYKWWNKTKWVKVEDMDIWKGRREVKPGEEEAEKEDRARHTRWWKGLERVIVG